MSAPADDTQGLDEILESMVRYVERGEANGRPVHFIGEYKQAILGWVNEVVIGENEAGERRGMRYVANSNTARRNTLRNKHRNILREHGYKEDK